VGTASGDLGTYLTAGNGRAVYLWEGDSSGVSNCTSACATVWPPVLTTGEPQASGGVDASLLGTISRSDGSLQVTYQGWPLYYFAHDTSSGQTTGEGSTGFGAAWWLVAPSGAAITTGASSSTPSSPAPSRGGYGY
jgi:predicted lipoprotein with Yx(FWY)xxD motif